MYTVYAVVLELYLGVSVPEPVRALYPDVLYIFLHGLSRE
jgi:hypothetical protein